MTDPATRMKNLRSGFVLAWVALGMTIFLVLSTKALGVSIPGFSGYYWAFIFFSEGCLIALFVWQIRRLNQNRRPSREL
jgi:hypothetical protein